MHVEKEIEVLKSILGGFFKDQFYKEGVLSVRSTLPVDNYYNESWEKIIRIILLRKLPVNALDFVYEYANVSLHFDSENEAYNWLTLMIINVVRDQNEHILEYSTFLNPSDD